jgi:uncharacterized membrane protein YoaK (UPF0700 family)
MEGCDQFPRATRDWLLILLTGCAGCIDAAVFLRTHVFPANMTGNTVLMGLALVRLNAGEATMNVLALAGFFLGAAAAAWTVNPPGSGREWSRRINIALIAAAMILLGSAAAVRLETPLAVSVFCAAFAMGIQSQSVQQLAVSGISTNVVTSTLTAGARRLVSLVRLRRSGEGSDNGGPNLHLSCWSAYLAGAIVGGSSSQLASWTPFVLSALTLLAVAGRATQVSGPAQPR